MNAEVQAAEGSQVQEAAPETKAKGKKANTGNLIVDVATEIENLTKQKALNMAENLVETIEEDYFKLGGVLKKIHEQSWHDGSASFDDFVLNKFGFASRKARYLMEIYDKLVTNQIPWEKVKHLGWTKLKDLAKVLTPENVDEWVAKAEQLSVAQLQVILKEPTGDGSASAKTTDDVTVLKFKLKNDQVDTVQSALSKAKAEVKTEYDTVALEMICTGYLGNSVTITSASLADQIKAVGWQAALETFTELYPNIDLTVDASKHSD